MNAKLFTSLKIRDIEIKNRIMMSPMCQYSAKDGFLNDWHYVHYGTRAVGQVGLIMVEATAIEPEGRITPWDLGIWTNEHIEPFAKLVKIIEDQGSVAGIQLAHAGRKASAAQPWKNSLPLSNEEGGWEIIAPSPIPFASNSRVPHELTLKEIDSLISKFVLAAQNALQAGFKIVEIHSAHGYLLHEFLSPISNKREDLYGGSLENRQRLLLTITRKVREIWPENLPVFTRISATDWVEDGWNITDSIDTAKKLKEIGVDLIDVSSGGNVDNLQLTEESGYQVAFSSQIKKLAATLTSAVGKITEPAQANDILESGKADIVALGRELLRNPYWAFNAAKELNSEIDWPNQYLRSK